MYSPLSDLWSVGVIMYVLMTGDPPLPTDIYSNLTTNLVGSPELERTYKLMVTTPIDFVGEPWGDFPEACDLCQWLMSMDVTSDVNLPLKLCSTRGSTVSRVKWNKRLPAIPKPLTPHAGNVEAQIPPRQQRKNRRRQG